MKPHEWHADATTAETLQLCTSLVGGKVGFSVGNNVGLDVAGRSVGICNMFEGANEIVSRSS